MKPAMKSRIWAWIILLLPIPLTLWSGYLVLTVAHLQRDLRQAVVFMQRIEGLRESLRLLEDEVLMPVAVLPDVLPGAREQQLQQNCEAILARLSPQVIKELEFAAGLERVSQAVRDLVDWAAQAHHLPADASARMELARQARRSTSVAIGDLRGMVATLRDQSAIISRELAARWTALNFIVLISCLMAVLVVVLLYSYRLSAAALKKAEDDRDRFFSLSADMLCIAGFDGRFKQLSGSWERVLGYPVADMLGRTYVDFAHPDDQAGLLAELDRVKIDAAAPDYPCRFRSTNAGYRWLLWNATADRERQLIYATARDVTEQKIAERTLWESERRLHILYEVSTQLEYGTDEQFQEVLRVATLFLGQQIGIISHIEGDQYTVEHFHSRKGSLRRGQTFKLGQTYCSITFEAGDVVSIEHMSVSAYREHPCFREFSLESYIGVVITVDGEPFGTLCFASFEPRGTLWTDADRELVRLLGQWVSRAIEKRRAEEALRESAARIRAIVDGAVDGIITIDEDGSIESYNPACERIFGYLAEQVVGQNVKMLMPMATRERHDGYLSTYQQTGKRGIMGAGRHVTGQRADGTTVPLHLSVSEVSLGDRRIFTGIVRDITELQRAHAELEDFASRLARSNRDLDDFASIASHDLQEPLRKVTTFGDRLKAKCGGTLDEQGRDYLERMQNAARRMQTLIHDLLAFSRVTTKTQPFVPVDLGQVVGGVLSDLEVRIEELGAQIDVGELPTVDADPLQIQQLIQNLIGNALKFHRAGESPHVRISAAVVPAPVTEPGGESPGMQCRLEVADNGIGFEEKYRTRIFNVFQRLHGRDAYEGTGIGLAICRKIAERHNGTITAAAQPNEGATFTVLLPLRQPPRDTDRQKSAAAEHGALS